MINRVLIRMKVMQVLYSFYQKEERSLAVAEQELLHSLEKSYELYHFLLLLMVELTDFQDKRVDAARNKFLPTHEDKNPNIKFVNNRFVESLRQNKSLNAYIESQKISWINEPIFLKNLMEQILASDIYTDYMNESESSFESDREFWRNIFKTIILEDDFMHETLESISLYWNDDLIVIGTFVLKTIKQFDPTKGADQPLLPMFKASDDKEYAVKLFRQSILRDDEYRQMIDEHTKNWEMDRIAFMDIIIMQTAICELLNFPTIPVKVSLNEYIELAKSYSTPKSGVFVNGVLNSLVNQLKLENKLTKN